MTKIVRSGKENPGDEIEMFRRFAESKIGVLIHNGSGDPVLLHSVSWVDYRHPHYLVEFVCLGEVCKRRYKHLRLYQRHVEGKARTYAIVSVELHAIKGVSNA